MDTVAADSGKNILDAITFAMASDVGLRREENQDAYGLIERPHFKLLMVADGMGGAQGGATASQLAVKTITEKVGDKDSITAEELVGAIYDCNTLIFKTASENPDLLGMGTTFVGLFFKDTTLYVLNVGDSRAYRIREGKVQPMTEDHTLVKELVKSGAISVEQAENHPISHMLTRSLGPAEETVVDCVVSPDGPVRGDIYLLCSDGLYNLVQDHEFVSLIQGVSLEEGAQRLIALANERGGVDNITVVLAAVGDEYPVTLDDISVYYDDDVEEKAASPAEQIPAAEVAGFPRRATPEDLPNEENPGQPRPGAVSSEEHARRLDILIEETAQILERQKRQEVQQNKKMLLLVFLILCVLVSGIYFAVHTLNQSREMMASESWTPGDENSAADPAAVTKETVIGYVSNYRSRYPVAPRLVDLQLELPSIATLWPDPGDDDPQIPQHSSAAVTGLVQGGHLLDAEKGHIRERKEMLRGQISRLQAKLERFGQPITQEFGNALRESAGQTEALQKSSDELRAQLDTATRKLSVWFDRKKRLEVGDPVNMASEVAVTSDDVRLKKEAFEKVTWDYLKELEALRFNQRDAVQEKKVSELLAGRNESVKDLTSEVKKTVEQNIAAADQEISELTQKRDAIDAQLSGIAREVDFIRSIMNASPDERDILKAAVIREKNSAEAELQELTRILPDSLN